jgi:hypothetical protein
LEKFKKKKKKRREKLSTKIDIKIIDPRLVDNLPAYATTGSATGFADDACLTEPLVLQNHVTSSADQDRDIFA